MIAVATLGCSRKLGAIHSWETLTKLEGDYDLYVNYECQFEPMPLGTEADFLISQATELGDAMKVRGLNFFMDVWSWYTFGQTIGREVDQFRYCDPIGWRGKPKFDQDQARLASIVCARNMCIEFAIQRDATHLLFVDADIVPPFDIIPKLLEVGEDAVGGLVHGRGDHANCQYVFGEKRRYKHEKGFELIEAEHGNVGYILLSRRLIEQVRFRYGKSEYPDGRNHVVSDDPAYHLDAFIKFGKWMVIRPDALGRHVGQLKAEEIAQF